MTTSRRERELREAIASARAKLEDERAFVDELFEHHPLGAMVADTDGSLRMNQACHELAGIPNREIPVEERGDDEDEHGWYREDGVTKLPIEEMPILRSLTERVPYENVKGLLRSPARPEGAWLSVASYPLSDGRAFTLFRDETEERELRHRLEAQNAELGEQVRESEELSSRLKLALEELSTPVIELWEGVLALPLVGGLDSNRSSQMRERLLTTITERGSHYVIVDLTGVEHVDTSTANTLLGVAAGVRLLGAHCVVSGIQPSVAQTLVSLGADLSELITTRNLAHALQYCLAAKRGRRA